MTKTSGDAQTKCVEPLYTFSMTDVSLSNKRDDDVSFADFESFLSFIFDMTIDKLPSEVQLD